MVWKHRKCAIQCARTVNKIVNAASIQFAAFIQFQLNSFDGFDCIKSYSPMCGLRLVCRAHPSMLTNNTAYYFSVDFLFTYFLSTALSFVFVACSVLRAVGVLLLFRIFLLIFLFVAFHGIRFSKHVARRMIVLAM